MAQVALERVGWGDKSHRLPGQLSGGEQERVAIARAIVNEPPIVLADEPTGCLDTRTGLQVMELLKSFNEEGLTVMLVTHNPDNARYAHRTIPLKDGQVEKECQMEREKLSFRHLVGPQSRQPPMKRPLN